MKMALWVLIAAVVLLGGYIRFSPSDTARWHVAAQGADKDMRNGVVRVVNTGPNGLAKLDAIATDAPRTRVLAGSVPEGMVTYITRSKVFGFPDYTTVQQDGDELRVYARSRFGRRDFGVNQDRVSGWLALLQP
ncbi:DUF1499 domain-containing protein [uncultured Ruegeria sp.]|uniref:DUF1499 domain-containing protein n=1 Tax=uncultured Ruegeria sp. TaxID=259304 RepID=UPI00262C7EBD|nr:DUF1499 domain-containing protein [uncultured Ruegeria sp.]